MEVICQCVVSDFKENCLRLFVVVYKHFVFLIVVTIHTLSIQTIHILSIQTFICIALSICELH